MNKQKFFALIMAALMWTCVILDIFTTIRSINNGAYGITPIAVGAGIICVGCGIRYTKELFKND